MGEQRAQATLEGQPDKLRWCPGTERPGDSSTWGGERLGVKNPARSPDLEAVSPDGLQQLSFNSKMTVRLSSLPAQLAVRT